MDIENEKMNIFFEWFRAYGEVIDTFKKRDLSDYSQDPEKFMDDYFKQTEILLKCEELGDLSKKLRELMDKGIDQ